MDRDDKVNVAERPVDFAAECTMGLQQAGRGRELQGIGWAIKQLHHGLKVRRRGWNGRGMWLSLQVPDKYSKMTLPYVYMRTAFGDLVPWLCSQTDLLASDWEVATADVPDGY